VTDPRADAARLAAGAVETLPAGELERQLERGSALRVKLGIDPTAPDIHLGHVVVLQKLREFQDAGHIVVLIVGDYTARIGDPSGRAEERPVLANDEIDANAETFKAQAFQVLDRDRVEVRRNSEWLEMPSGELFDLIRRFTVARLLERDDLTNRMEAGAPVAALELLYPVLQGYDSVAVKADVELGGTDQKFNLLFARDVQTAFGQQPQSVLTLPILPGTDGVRRMSKSLGNYVGVTDEPAEMFGKLMSVPDEAMGEYFKLLLDHEPDEARPPVEQKRELAAGIVARFHGDEAAAAAEARFDRVHIEGGAPEDIPEVELGEVDGEGNVHLPLLISSAFELSKSEARRLIDQGGVKLDGEPLTPGQFELSVPELRGKTLQVGKRRFALLVPPGA
jgi:tyrosyl-tRNA synthetase